MRTANLLVALAALAAGCPGDTPQPPPPARPGDAPATTDAGGGGGGGAGDPTKPPAPAPGGGAPQGAPVPGDPVSAPALAALDEPTLREWTERALTHAQDAYRPTEKAADHLVKYLAESSGACSIFLLEAFDPHRGAKGGATWTARAATNEQELDLLRCTWKKGELAFALTEGANFLAIEVSPPEPATPAGVQELLERLVRTESPVEGGPPRAWKVKVPGDADLSKGAHRFTSAGAPPVLKVQGRDDRMDVLVLERRVFFVFYKKIPQRFGWQPGDAWFDAETRAKLKG